MSVKISFIFQAMTGVYLITFIGGYEFWKFSLFGFTASEWFEVIMHGKNHIIL